MIVSGLVTLRGAAACFCAFGLMFGSGSAVFASGMSVPRPLNSYADADNINHDDVKPRIATDGAGRWLAGWIDPYQRLAISTSTTSATEWSDLRHLDGTTGVNQADLCYAGDGQWVALRAFNPLHLSDNIDVAVSSDFGGTWSSPTDLLVDYSEARRFNNAVQLESDGAGRVVALFDLRVPDGDNLTRQMISTSTDFGHTWSEPTLVSVVPQRQASHPARIAYAGGDRWLLVYTRVLSADQQAVEYMLAESNDMGNTWNEIGPLFVSRLSGGSSTPTFDIHVHGSEAAIAFYGMYGHPEMTAPGVGVTVLSSNDGGTTFSAPLMFETPTVYVDGRLVAVATDAAGNWLLTGNDGQNQMASLKVWGADNPAGPWTLVRTVSGGGNLHPALAGAGDGTFVMLSEHFPVDPSKLVNDRDIRAQNTLNAGAGWSDFVFVNSTADTDLVRIDDTTVSMAANGDVVVAVWTASVIYPYSGVGLQRGHKIMMSRSVDNGRIWQAARPVPGSLKFVESGAPLNPALVTAGADDTFEIYWHDKKMVVFDAGQTFGSVQSGITSPGEPDNTFVRLGINHAVRVVSTTSFDAESNLVILNTYSEVSTDGEFTWHPRRLVHSQTRKPFAIKNESVGYPEILSFGDGRLVVLVKNLWIGQDVPLDHSSLRHVDLFVAESSNAAESWGSVARVTGKARSRTAFITSGDRITVAWDQLRPPNSMYENDIMYSTKLFGTQSAAGGWMLYE